MALLHAVITADDPCRPSAHLRPAVCLSGLRLGMPPYFWDAQHLDPAVGAVLRAAVRKLEAAGAAVVRGVEENGDNASGVLNGEGGGGGCALSRAIRELYPEIGFPMAMFEVLLLSLYYHHYNIPLIIIGSRCSMFVLSARARCPHT